MSLVSPVAKIKGLVILIIAFIISLLANTISAMLGKLVSIPIVGFLFKFLQFPFKLIGIMRIPLIIIIVVFLFFSFILPVIAKHIKKHKTVKVDKRAELLDEAEDKIVNDVVMQELSNHASGTPGRINF